MDANLAYWEKEDASVVANAKGALLYDTWECPSWWGEATDELFCGFQDILVPIVRQKNTIRTSCRSTPAEKRERLEAVARGPAGDVYDRVLQLFDNALAAYEREDLEGGRNATATLAAAEPSPAIPSKNSSSNPNPLPSLSLQSTQSQTSALLRMPPKSPGRLLVSNGAPI
ncbi:hypothetical protein D9611_014941 [Ephemerocybe angulata]|uniref:Uncharacterized protein n=1 Tax=Ephemerocybe angulata TaxID=980116 RepID=A0A8H5C4G7_9AGAR|nr:hypothetical protein D9611_014941 [Tulosesus angulatus]